jgi:hypothetical protein
LFEKVEWSPIPNFEVDFFASRALPASQMQNNLAQMNSRSGEDEVSVSIYTSNGFLAVTKSHSIVHV